MDGFSAIVSQPSDQVNSNPSNLLSLIADDTAADMRWSYFFLALELKQVFDQIAAAEKAGVSPEEKKKLEEQAAEKVCVDTSRKISPLLPFP